MGCLALALLVVEFLLVLRLRSIAFEDYLAGRDPVSGTVYYLLLGAFAAMPLVFRRKPSPPRL